MLLKFILLGALSLVRTVSATPTGYISFESFLGKLLESDQLKHCMIQIYFTSPSNLVVTRDKSVPQRLNIVLKLAHERFDTSGVVISEIGTRSDSRKFQQPSRGNIRRCSFVVVDALQMDSASKLREHKASSFPVSIISPELNPPTVRNRDFYLILSEENWSPSKETSLRFQKFKYKLFALFRPDRISSFPRSFIKVGSVCQYGLCKNFDIHTVDTALLETLYYSGSVMEKLFADQESNFFGHTLRLSTTTKVPQLLEMDTFPDAYGRNVLKPKRGLYASVLKELSHRLNFTFDIVPSSGSGSTGHALPNGTWVGTVGDTYNGVVDFGLMAAITYHRFPYAEFCAPINFAYLGFVTGPPQKSYSWHALFWSFTPLTWLLILIVMLVSAGLVSVVTSPSVHKREFLMLKEMNTGSIKWSYLKGLSFLVRGLLEQNAPIPKHANISLRIFLLFWLGFTLVCATAYRSKMVSLLTFPVFNRNPESFDELAKDHDFKIGFHYFGNVGYAYFKTSTNPSFVNIFNRMEKEPNPLKCLQKTLDQRASCIIFIITFQELLYRNLSDHYGKSPLKFIPHDGAMFPAGVIHQYKAPLSSNFKSILTPAMESGIIPFWQNTDLHQILREKNQWQKETNAESHSLIFGSEEDDNLLRVRNLRGAFALLSVGVLSGILAFGLEKKLKRDN